MKEFINRDRLFPIFCIAFFAIIFGLISFVNHFQLRTSALDLGVFNHAVYSFANLKQAIFTLGVDGKEIPFLGTHFSLITILYVPLYFLFGTYTLLVIQIAAILLGGVAIYKYAVWQFNKNTIYPKLILIQFFSIWGIYSALSFDFHNNVVASMLVVWFVYFLEKRKFLKSAIFFLLVLISKENMSIWMFFIVLGLMIKNRKVYRNEYLKFEIPLALFSLVYAIIVIGYIMPLIQGSESNLQLARYSHLGSSFTEIIITIFKRPFYTIGLLFKNILEDLDYNGIKLELHYMVLVSGGICLFLRPAYLVMLIPIYAQKLFSNDYNFWGLNLQYSIEFVPIISLAFIDLLKQLKKYKLHIAVGITVLTIVFTVNSINHRKSKWYNKTNTMFYARRHYDPKLNLKEIKFALNLIDDEASLSASSNLIPQLAFREKVYIFPIVKDAKYIALFTENRSSYPLSKEDFDNKVSEYKNSEKYSVIYNDNDLLIFERNN